MIVLLEGVNGCGKTTAAKGISNKLGWPILRPLRTENIHMEEAVAQYKALGVPANTHVDDVYAADFLAKFKVNAILDRSMPSALAYGIEDDGMDMAMVGALYKWWSSRLAGIPMVYVWMSCDYETAKARSPRVPAKGRWNNLDRHFARFFSHLPSEFVRIHVDTTSLTSEQTLVRVLTAVPR